MADITNLCIMYIVQNNAYSKMQFETKINTCNVVTYNENKIKWQLWHTTRATPSWQLWHTTRATSPWQL